MSLFSHIVPTGLKRPCSPMIYKHCVPNGTEENIDNRDYKHSVPTGQCAICGISCRSDLWSRPCIRCRDQRSLLQEENRALMKIKITIKHYRVWCRCYRVWCRCYRVWCRCYRVWCRCVNFDTLR